MRTDTGVLTGLAERTVSIATYQLFIQKVSGLLLFRLTSKHGRHCVAHDYADMTTWASQSCSESKAPQFRTV